VQSEGADQVILIALQANRSPTGKLLLNSPPQNSPETLLHPIERFAAARES